MELCNRKYVIKPYGQFDIPATFDDIHCLQHAMAVCWQTRNLLISTIQSLKWNKQYQKKRAMGLMKQKLSELITPTTSSPPKKAKVRKLRDK